MSCLSTQLPYPWMKDLVVGDRVTLAQLTERLKVASSQVEYQRIQRVLVRATSIGHTVRLIAP